MVYNMIGPSKNMRISQTELNRMIREQNEEMAREEREKELALENAANREYEEKYRRIAEAYVENNNRITDRATRMQNVKEAFLSECLLKLFCESCVLPMNSKDKIVARNLVNKFVRENGAYNLLCEFETKNLLLSEFNRICTKYYDKVLNESCEKKDLNTTTEIYGEPIRRDIIDDFYKELSDVDTEDAAKAIKDRVADSITNFVDTTTAAKYEYEDVIRQAQEKAAAVKDEAIGEFYIENATAKINSMRNNRTINIYNYLVESLTKSVITDKDLSNRYIHEGKIDMDGVTSSATLIYTMLEMVNTTNMVNVDTKFIEKTISEL